MKKKRLRNNPTAFAPPAGDAVQVIGSPLQMMRGKPPTLRAMTLDDIEDDCPLCLANRDRILAGDPPMVYAFD